jgi:hypothetical protein
MNKRRLATVHTADDALKNVHAVQHALIEHTFTLVSLLHTHALWGT